jgi:cobalamin biosynthesis protein CobT
MSGAKFEMACAGAGALAEALKPLNIPYSVYGFTNFAVDKQEDPMVWLFSEFGERVNQRTLIDRFKHASGALWNNSDGDAIAYATYRLQQRKEHRKVLLVLSDGSPAGREYAGDVVGYTRKTIDDAEKLGIDTYGIGICDTNVVHFYKKNVVVRELNQLSPTILSIIDRSI